MAYCKKCNVLREENLTYCPECMEILTKDSSVHEDSQDKTKEVLLTTIATEEEALVVEGLLKSADIFYFRRYDKIGDYLKVSMGTTSLGVSIYVREEELDFAKALLDSEPEDVDKAYLEYVESDDNDEIAEEYSGKTGIQLVFFLVLLLILIYIATR